MAAMLGQLCMPSKSPVSSKEFVLREQDSGLLINIDEGKIQWACDEDGATSMCQEDAKELAQYFMFRAHQSGIETIVHYEYAGEIGAAPDFFPDSIDEDGYDEEDPTSDCE